MLHAREREQQAAELVLGLDPDLAADVALGDFTYQFDGLVQGPHDGAHDQQYGPAGQGRDQHAADNQHQLPLLGCSLGFLDHFQRTPGGERAVFCGGAHQRGQQRAAFCIHLGHCGFALIVQHHAENGHRHRFVLAFYAGDIVDHGTHFGIHAGFSRQLLEFGKIFAHIPCGALDCGFFLGHVLGRSHQRQIARGDRAFVDSKPHLVGRIGTGLNALDVIAECRAVILHHLDGIHGNSYDQGNQ